MDPTDHKKVQDFIYINKLCCARQRLRNRVGQFPYIADKGSCHMDLVVVGRARFGERGETEGKDNGEKLWDQKRHPFSSQKW